MNTSDWALIISLSSFGVSLAGFLWNVWSKFIYPKAQVRVHAGIFQTFTPGVGAGASFINMTATNFGPGEITLTHAVVHEPKRWPFRKGMDGILKLQVTDPDDPHPQYDVFGRGQLPRKLAVGEQTSARLSKDANLFEKASGSRRLGFIDSFGRRHWVSLKATRKLRQDLSKEASST
jgi:hypothetical protein